MDDLHHRGVQSSNASRHSCALSHSCSWLRPSNVQRSTAWTPSGRAKIRPSSGFARRIAAQGGEPTVFRILFPAITYSKNSLSRDDRRGPITVLYPGCEACRMNPNWHPLFGLCPPLKQGWQCTDGSYVVRRLRIGVVVTIGWATGEARRWDAVISMGGGGYQCRAG